MLLALNIGNTNISLTFFTDGSSQEPCGDIYRLSAASARTSDECAAMLRLMLPADMLKKCSLVAISSVVPRLTNAVSAAVAQLISAPLIDISRLLRSSVNGTNKSLTLPIQPPQREMGCDLLANAVSAFIKTKAAGEPRACITADFGTAFTCIAVTSNGAIAGVSISPGLGTSYRALIHNTALIAHSTVDMPATSLGTNTNDAVNAGTALGFFYLAHGLIHRIKKDLGEPVVVYGTGGDIQTLTHSNNPQTLFDETDPYHTLRGIEIIARHNANQKSREAEAHP